MDSPRCFVTTPPPPLPSTAVRGDPGLGCECWRATHPLAGRWRLHPAHHLLQRAAGEGGRGGEQRYAGGSAGWRRRGAGGWLHPTACTAAFLHECKDGAKLKSVPVLFHVLNRVCVCVCASVGLCEQRVCRRPTVSGALRQECDGLHCQPA